MHRKSQSHASALGSVQQQAPRSGWATLLAWLNASKGVLGACLILGLVGYAVFFPHPERSPADVAQPILPSQAAVSQFQGSPRQEPAWLQLHQQYVDEIKAKAAKKEGLDLAFYGDSITESWRGLQVGRPVEKFKGIPEVFARLYGGIKAAAYSIAGDQTVHLHWRLVNGEGPATLRPRVAVVLIGTNDLTTRIVDLQDTDAVSTQVGAGAVAAVEAILQQSPATRVLLLGLLPRGSRAVEAPSVAYIQPSKFTPAIEATNEKLQAYAQLNSRVAFLDCTPFFLEDDDKVEGGKRLVRALMPDALHPGPAGMEQLAACMQPQLAKFGLQTGPSKPSRLLLRLAA